MLARDIMTRDPLCVVPTDPVWKAAELMRYHEIGCVPVIDDSSSGRVVGMLTDRDIATRCVARRHSGNCTVAAHMSATPIHCVLETDEAAHAMRRMEQTRIRRVPVLSATGQIVGIITQGDVIRRLGHSDPLIVERSMELVHAGQVSTW